LEPLGLTFAGLRPPGGQLGPGGTEVLRDAGLRYCSPAGSGAGVDGGVALLPFQWRHVDATCLLPPLAPVRERMTGSPEPIDPDTFVAYLETGIDRLSQEGGFATIVLHLPLLDWLGEKNLDSILTKLTTSTPWLARCDEIADHILASSADFEGGATPDPTSWT
jgi:hypothetical protein